MHLNIHDDIFDERLYEGKENIGSKFQISIYDLNGRQITPWEVSERLNRLDISALNSGVYLLKVINYAGVIVEKFIKK